MPLTLRANPVCPVCSQDLRADVTRFYLNIALCEVCWQTVPMRRIDEIVLHAFQQADPADWAEQRGLRFYIPRPHVRRNVSADYAKLLDDAPPSADLADTYADLPALCDACGTLH